MVHRLVSLLILGWASLGMTNAGAQETPRPVAPPGESLREQEARRLTVEALKLKRRIDDLLIVKDVIDRENTAIARADNGGFTAPPVSQTRRLAQAVRIERYGLDRRRLLDDIQDYQRRVDKWKQQSTR